MSQPFLGEVKIVSFNFPPKGWAFCNGQLLPINQNQALFSILGTTYGGDGRVNFALPNLQGSVPLHFGSGITLGQKAGEAAHTVISTEMPLHTHQLTGTSSAGAVIIPTGNLLASAPNQLYHAPDANSGSMSATSVSTYGGSQAHENRMPFLVLNFCIALVGIFPSRN